MKVMCIYCAKAGEPALIREKEPLADPRTTHGVCPRHYAKLRQDLEAIGVTLKPGSRTSRDSRS